MSRSTLKILAVLLGVLMVGVYFAGLDGLPRTLRTQIETERTALATAQTQMRATQDAVLRDLQTEAELFRGVSASQTWPEQLSKDLGDLQLAGHEMEQLTALAKRNRRGEREQAEALLAKVRGLRTAAANQAAGVQKQAAHWVDIKRHLPDEVRQMERDYEAIRKTDLNGVSAATQKAAADWPEKQADLNAKLSKLREATTQADALWQSTDESRRMAAANDLAHLDLAGLVAAADWLQRTAAELPKQAEELKGLDAQLYRAWDKVLVDMEVRGGKPQQKLRTIQTVFADASSKSGQITSDESWVEVSPGVYESGKRNLGMAIAHKAAGKYDIEAERVPQPPGFAYMAPPSQGSNQYGYWEHRGGRDFWVFYGQYALLRDLLFNQRYDPIDRYDWEGYRSYHTRRETYYGGGSSGTATAGQRYGTQGTTTQERYSGSRYSQGGGFKDSKFTNKGGSYGDSKYATPSGDRAPREFGSGNRPSERRASPPPSRPSTSRPSSSRPSSAPRRFGKR